MRFRGELPDATQARTLVALAISKGALTPQPCEVADCSTGTEVIAHHDDYSKPLDVRWLCRSHHYYWHRENGPAAPEITIGADREDAA